MNVRYTYNDSHDCLGIKKIGFFKILVDHRLRRSKKGPAKVSLKWIWTSVRLDSEILGISWSISADWH